MSTDGGDDSGPPQPPIEESQRRSDEHGHEPHELAPPPGYDPIAAYGAPPMPPPMSPDDAPILPPAYQEGDIAAAVGAPTRRRPPTLPPVDEQARAEQRGRRTVVLSALAVVAGLIAVALVFLGRANSGRYLVTCATDHMRAEQGRSFPPWGSHPLTGAEWKPVPLPSNAECTERETESEDELGKWYLTAIVEQAKALLTARAISAMPARTSDKDPPSALDIASDELHQALLLARDPGRRTQRNEIEHLLGDVDYWRASIRLRDVTAALVDAATQFETAATQHPLQVSDAETWATFVRRVADELKAGPNAAPATPATTPPTLTTGTTPVPLGTALPVEPDGGSAVVPVPPPDAGVPSGGVLL